VQSAQDAAARARLVLLHEPDVHAMLAPGVLAKGLDQEAALVAVRGCLDQDEIGDLGLDAHHPGHELTRDPLAPDAKRRSQRMG
jgi:hypothetical protein